MLLNNKKIIKLNLVFNINMSELNAIFNKYNNLESEYKKKRKELYDEDNYNDALFIGNQQLVSYYKKINKTKLKKIFNPLYLDIQKYIDSFGLEKYVDNIIEEDVWINKKSKYLNLLGFPDKEFSNTWKKNKTQENKNLFKKTIMESYTEYGIDVIKDQIRLYINCGCNSYSGFNFQKKLYEFTKKKFLHNPNIIVTNGKIKSNKNSRDIDIHIQNKKTNKQIAIETTLASSGNSESRDKKCRLSEMDNCKKIILLTATSKLAKEDLEKDDIQVIQMRNNINWKGDYINSINNYL
jgi:hypothetical protein